VRADESSDELVSVHGELFLRLPCSRHALPASRRGPRTCPICASGRGKRAVVDIGPAIAEGRRLLWALIRQALGSPIDRTDLIVRRIALLPAEQNAAAVIEVLREVRAELSENERELGEKAAVRVLAEAYRSRRVH